MNRASFRKDLEQYVTPYSDEQEFISRFMDLLFFDNCYERSLLSGHITGSAWILHPTLPKVLMMHHKKLDRWLQPGGHADGDEDLLNVAKKEMFEETGLQSIEHIRYGSQDFFDIDIHLIPERKEIPEHYHFDLRFAFKALDPGEVKKNHESNNLKWIDLHQLENYVGNEASILRMRDKSLRFI